MTCPYFEEVTMVFCRAYPVKKLVPVDQVTTASACAGEFRECPLYGEALARAARSASEGEEQGRAGSGGATP